MHTRPHRPRSFDRGVLLVLGAFAGALGCEGGGTPGTEDPALAGATVGEVETLVADLPDGTSERLHFLNIAQPDGARLRLRFVGQVSGQPDLTSGDRIGVWGDRTGDEFRVVRYALAPLPAAPETSVVSALIGATPKPRTAVFVIVDLGGGSNITNASATSTVFNPGNNFASVYDKLSFGIQKMSGDVQGPFSYPMTTCDYNGLRNAVKPMVTGTYQHYMWYFGSQVSACNWSGIGAEGNTNRPQSDSWYNRSTGCTVLVQEVGHNMGWMHSSTLACSGATFADDPTTCTSSEYGNRMTPMGSGCGMLNGHDLWYGQFIGGCNGVRVTASGTFNLFALENACNAIQTIQIPMIKTTRQAKPTQGNNQPLKNYYLEFRTKTGLDASLTQAVYVYAGDDIRTPTRSSNWSWLLDMNPSTSTFDGLQPGGSFTDPTGEIKITVMSADTTKAVVQIDVQGGAGAAPTCIDNSTVEPPGPADCGSGPVTGTGGTTGAGGAGGTNGRGGTSGTAGTNGRGGTVGTAGAGGRGGTSGTAGTTGTPGSAGTNGVAGTNGAAGTNGSAGTNGRGGTGGGMVGPGSAGTNGGPGVAGTSGNPTGTAGTGVTTGVAGSPGPGTGGKGTPGEVTGGCACELGASDRGGFGWTAIGLGAAGLLIRRRRRR